MSESSERKTTPQATPADESAAQNTDRELWREREGDYYADSIHVTAQGGIGMNCGGTVIVKSIRDWHALAAADIELPAPAKVERVEQSTERVINIMDALRDSLKHANKPSKATTTDSDSGSPVREGVGE